MKKVNTWKKVVAGVALCSMAASMASAIKWAPVNTPAYWDDTANWDLGALPGADEKTQFSSDIETECIVRYTNACGQLVLGDGGNAAQTVNMRIVDGGVLNAKLAGGSWVGVGYNRNAHCTVEAGGEINSGTRIGVGMIGGLPIRLKQVRRFFLPINGAKACPAGLSRVRDPLFLSRPALTG